MLKDKFLKRKQDVLSKIDKSFKSKWDEKIVKLCEKINCSERYYTTSSCSGRVVLMIDDDKKKGNLFLKIYHDLINFNQLKKDLMKIASLFPDINKKQLTKEDRGLIDSKKIRASDNERGNLIKFKMEPCILHVACRSLEDTQKLYDKAKLAGWKKSGVIALERRFVVELNSTEKLEFPIIEKNRILVDDDFLKIVVIETNRKLKKSWEKIEKLINLLE